MSRPYHLIIVEGDTALFGPQNLRLKDEYLAEYFSDCEALIKSKGWPDTITFATDDWEIEIFIIELLKRNKLNFPVIINQLSGVPSIQTECLKANEAIIEHLRDQHDPYP